MAEAHPVVPRWQSSAIQAGSDEAADGGNCRSEEAGLLRSGDKRYEQTYRSIQSLSLRSGQGRCALHAGHFRGAGRNG